MRSLLLFFLFVVPLPLFAETPEEQAQKYFEDGAALFFSGDYGGAISKFTLGHDTVKNPLFPFNISLCYQRLGRFQEALDAAKEADAMEGLGENTLPNRARIVALSRIISATSVEWPVEEITSPPVVTRSRWGVLGWLGVGSLLVSAGVLTAAVITELDLQETFDAYTAAGNASDADEFERLRVEVDTLQTRGKILLFSGIGVGVLGAVLIIADLATVEEKEIPVSIVPTKNGFAASLRLRF